MFFVDKSHLITYNKHLYNDIKVIILFNIYLQIYLHLAG